MFQVAVCHVVLFHYVANGFRQVRKLKQSAKPKDKLQTTYYEINYKKNNDFSTCNYTKIIVLQKYARV